MSDLDGQDTGDSSLLADIVYSTPGEQILPVRDDPVLGEPSEFHRKLLIILVVWLVVNLFLIRIAWSVYGNRLTEMFSGTNKY